MRRRDALLGTGLLAAAAAARAQSPKRPRVGVLTGGTPAGENFGIAALREGLAGRGYVEPESLELVVRFADGEVERFPSLARELVAARVDIIVTGSTTEVRAAMNATKTIPIVSAGAGDMVATGLVDSLARPGGNVTGLTMLSIDLGAKQLELLTEMLPGLARVAVLRGPTGGTGARVFETIQVAGAARGIEARDYSVASPGEIGVAFAAMEAARRQAVIVAGGPTLNRHHTLIASLAAARRLPVMSNFRPYVDAGTLASYGPSLVGMWRRAAYFVDRILKGAKPADLPVEQPTTFELVINLRTARALGLTIPQLMLLRADEVIE